ncbi:MAG: hypothetical protein Tsb002_11770 [Wenzhouxiangellaceae bacterium]
MTAIAKPQRGLLVRVGIDHSFGHWNAPVDSASGNFVYVPIPETVPSKPGLARPYRELRGPLRDFGSHLPTHLSRKRMHLDPDFEHLTYGDLSRKGKRIAQLQTDDLIVFYAGLRDQNNPDGDLVYAIIGLYVVDQIISVHQVAEFDLHRNAHTRCRLHPDADDIVVRARPGVSGRLQQCLPIGSRRLARNLPPNSTSRPVYRVAADLLDHWGGLSNNDGYLQRSAVPPEFNNVERFYRWFGDQDVTLLAANNP